MLHTWKKKKKKPGSFLLRIFTYPIPLVYCISVVSANIDCFWNETLMILQLKFDGVWFSLL